MTAVNPWRPELPLPTPREDGTPWYAPSRTLEDEIEREDFAYFLGTDLYWHRFPEDRVSPAIRVFGEDLDD